MSASQHTRKTHTHYALRENSCGVETLCGLTIPWNTPNGAPAAVLNQEAAALGRPLCPHCDRLDHLNRQLFEPLVVPTLLEEADNILKQVR